MKIKLLLYFSLILAFIFIFVNIFKEDTDSNLKQITIAFVDSGINSNDKNILHYDVFTNSKNTYDSYNHGTKIYDLFKENLVSKKQHKILDIKVLNKKGTTDVETFCKGIDYAIRHNADVINISLGFINNDKTLESCVKKASKNSKIFAASGDTLSDSTDYPAKYNFVESVAAIDKYEKLFSFSSTGKIDYVDYGVDVNNENKKEIINEMSGSSFAVPLVVAKYISYLEKNNKNIKYKIKDSNYKIMYYNE
ncbi:S8 family peptidase [Macrococcoides bohemicum]|uniref:S8 family peptidase n=1 Tax=Macrococcoides bohemicum TaxID=1903056 RepID=UPI00165D685A|nr:S8 family serine peptidase [Macrococcus bohemicus]MBC9874335.1 S8 family serine peptidase [Macrococcus bohemicus]